MKKIVWIIWGTLTLAIASYYGYTMFVAEDKESLLIGEATHGHHQIEMACGVCHTEAFGGTEVIQDACVSCHADELEQAHDSHPKSKFTDPRNADRIEILDARYCLTCHTEHQHEQTHDMGVTLPQDYCFHCHQDVGESRPSHQDIAYDSCADAGCHNYHDNRALYEDFLLEHALEDWLAKDPVLSETTGAHELADKQAIAAKVNPATLSKQHATEFTEWASSGHANAGISCVSCHGADDSQSALWVEKPEISVCYDCHKLETKGFLSGKHGMRLNLDLSALTPKAAKGEFHHDSISLQQGCSTCHESHSLDKDFAAVDACLTCHSDEHSTSFKQSPHGLLANQAAAGIIPENQAVTCATCHMPRVTPPDHPSSIVIVEHNQNAILRPNEKMIRPVCMECHGLRFAIDALADPNLILNNFNGQPAVKVPSIDWSIERQQAP